MIASPSDQKEKNPLDEASVDDLYVAFIDVLGFSARVLADFPGTVAAYRNLISMWRWQYAFQKTSRVTIYSDALILTTPQLGEIVGAVNMFLMLSLMNDCLVRGGIAFGRHIEAHEGENTYVVSEALTKAVRIEKTIRHPCVAIDGDITIPPNWWTDPDRNLGRPVLHFDGITLVNPCNYAWGASAQMRVRSMATAFPQHRDKFAWFLRLHSAIFSELPLVPDC